MDTLDMLQQAKAHPDEVYGNSRQGLWCRYSSSEWRFWEGDGFALEYSDIPDVAGWEVSD